MAGVIGIVVVAGLAIGAFSDDAAARPKRLDQAGLLGLVRGNIDIATRNIR